MFPRLLDVELRDESYVRELEQTRDRARAFAEHHVRPRALEIDRRVAEDPHYFDWDLVRAGSAYGLLSMAVPGEAGGEDRSLAHGALVMEELGAACPGVAIIFGAHALGISPLLVGGASYLFGLLRKVAEAEREGEPLLMACAITEPGAGTDVEDPDLLRKARVGTHARRVSGGYRLSGTKHFISNGSVATWVTVCMPTDPRRPADTWTGFLVDARSEGFSVGRVEHKMGQRACPAAELVFEDVFVPDLHVIGREGDGAPATAMVLAASRPGVGALSAGIARGAYERLVSWAEHDPVGDRLLERQHVQLALAQMEEEIHLARQAYMDAAAELDAALAPLRRHPLARAGALVPWAVKRRASFRRWQSSPRARRGVVELMRRNVTERAMTRSLALSSLAKANAADVAVRVTGRALELVGLGAGPVRAELEKLWRDAKLTQIFEGTNQLNRLEVYRGLCRGETMWTLPTLSPNGSGDPAEARESISGAGQRTPAGSTS